MNWAYDIKHKTKAALLLTLVLVLVLGKNIIDKSNTAELGRSFSSVYDDRLVAANYIYRMSDHLYQKKWALDNCTRDGQPDALRRDMAHHRAAIQSIIASYEATRLTRAEAVSFESLKESISTLGHLETAYLAFPLDGPESASTRSQMDHQFTAAVQHLQDLSRIQITEGKQLKDSSSKIIAGATLLTQFELVLLVVIGVLIQVLVFAAKSILPRIPQHPNLN